MSNEHKYGEIGQIINVYNIPYMVIFYYTSRKVLYG